MKIYRAGIEHHDRIWPVLEPVIRAGETYTLDRGLTREAALAYWFAPAHPATGPGLLESLRFGLRRLYELRLDVDYDAVPISRASAEAGVQTVHRLLAEIDPRTQGEPL